ncbi:MAG: hypothetical protein JXA46_06090 [Dehalococcoidales bacterium]|nr:hypothetical protein [Dehalococcoidales bacterium]
MKKVVGLFLVSILVLTFISISSSCSNSSANTSPLPTATEVPNKDLVENFVKNDATYAFDGIEGSLKFLKTIGSTAGNESNSIKEWEYIVEYQNRHPGEGDRTGQVLAQITTHNAIISNTSVSIP